MGKFDNLGANAALARAFAEKGVFGESRGDMSTADLANGGLLSPTQLKPFLSNLYASTPIYDLCWKELMTAPRHEISRIGFAGRILMAPPSENSEVASNRRSSATTAKTVLNAHQFRGEADISNRVILQNIMREDFVSFLMGEVAKRCGVDIAVTAMNGDTAISVVDAETEALAVMDGWLKQANSTGHVVDFAGTNIDVDGMDSIFSALPAKYVQEFKQKLRFLMEYNVARNWRRSVGRRVGQLADAAISSSLIADYSGAPVVSDATMNTTTSGGVVLSNVLFTDPENLVVGIHQEISIRVVDWPPTDSQRVFVKMEIDAGFARPDAVVIAKNIALLP